MTIKGQRPHEMTLYAVLWAILFAAPMLSMYIDHHTTGTACDWAAVYSAWRLLAVFLGIFALHNFLLAPLLVYGSRRAIYFSCVAAIMMSFSLYQCGVRPHPEPPETRHRHDRPPRHGKDEGMRMPREPRHEGTPPPRPFGGEDMVQILVVAMLLALNVGAKYYFKSLEERAQAKDLAHEHLQMQLEYLKYQINPHFFMNTLNNIHALVDFDPEKAQEAIEILSHLMRYVLYETNKPLAPLDKELAFVKNYMDIMRIRYCEVVSIEMRLPEQVPDVMVPPLIFATFLENAFKHGVSYEQKSYVSLSINILDETVEMCCRNSCRSTQKKGPGGVGLKNVTKRLQLLYGPDYTLTTTAGETEYNVNLKLPFNAKLKDKT